MVSRAKTESISIRCKKRRNVILFCLKKLFAECCGLQVFEDSGAGVCKKNIQKSLEKVWRERKKVYHIQKSLEKVWRERKKVYLCNPVREMGVRERLRGVPGWTWKDH